MLANEDFYDCYEYFYKRFYKNPKYRLQPKLKEKYVAKLDLLREQMVQEYPLSTLGREWMFKYVLFQFYRLSRVTINRFNGRIIFDDLTRQKSIDLFLRRNKVYDYNYLLREFCFQYNISLTQWNGDVKSTVPDSRQQQIAKRLREIEKHRFLNQKEGLLLCSEMMYTYEEDSKNCRMCIFKRKCI